MSTTALDIPGVLKLDEPQLTYFTTLPKERTSHASVSIARMVHEGRPRNVAVKVRVDVLL
jgi:hypothetical protein